MISHSFNGICSVLRGKIEDITLPDGITHVDIIISEWMGYALLYESMLDSVLHARDRFLKPAEEGGVMAPSQCQMMLGLCEGSELCKDRVDFWNDVYGMWYTLVWESVIVDRIEFEGFDLSTMAGSLYDEAIVDVVGPDAIISEPYVIKVRHLASSRPTIRLINLQGSPPKQHNYPPTRFLLPLQPDRKRHTPPNQNQSFRALLRYLLQQYRRPRPREHESVHRERR